MSSVFAKKYRNRTRWAHNVSKMVGYLLVGCSIFLLVLLFMLMHTNPNPVPALIIISAFVLLCFFYAYVIVLPDDLTLTATDRTLQTASQLLTFASQGLSPEMATGVCSIILPETFASAIAVTDGSLMLATAGKNADKYPMGH
ncbi:MAG: sensor histidine kinase, partial [Atopobium minutum]|nr:sensor histidine kinase [Atopobium minutum]